MDNLLVDVEKLLEVSLKVIQMHPVRLLPPERMRMPQMSSAGQV